MLPTGYFPGYHHQEHIPSTQSQWQLPSAGAGFDALRLVHGVPVGKPREHEVLVRMRACSLNYRDLALVTTTFYEVLPNVVPLSDGAGEIVALGSKVTTFKIGDRVAFILCPEVATSASMEGYGLPACLGGTLDGTLTQYKVASASGIVKIPDYMSFEEAASLPCAGATAWAALNISPHGLRPGSTVLVQGTGGVSVLAAQLAHAAGCRVIATSSSREKLQRLVDMGVVNAGDCINYREVPEWDSAVRALTPNNRGVDLVVDVAGPGSINKSLRATRRNGAVALVGVLDMGSPGSGLDYVEALMKCLLVRGVLVPEDRRPVEDMLCLMEQQDVHPVIDRVFPFERAVDALKYLTQGKHFGKVVVRL